MSTSPRVAEFEVVGRHQVVSLMRFHVCGPARSPFVDFRSRNARGGAFFWWPKFDRGLLLGYSVPHMCLLALRARWPSARLVVPSGSVDVVCPRLFCAQVTGMSHRTAVFELVGRHQVVSPMRLHVCGPARAPLVACRTRNACGGAFFWWPKFARGLLLGYSVPHMRLLA